MKMNKADTDMIFKNIPGCFLQLIEYGLIDESNIEKTDDGFLCLNKSVSEILALKGIYTFPTNDGNELRCDNYYDDWYIYAIEKDEDVVYSLFKLREQEYDMFAGERADYDSPGVAVSFIAYDINTLTKCLNEPTDKNRIAMSDEINRVVARRGQKHHSAIKRYFCKTESKASYLIAELYIRHILSFTHKGFIIVPQKYEEIYSASLAQSKDSKEKRLPDFIKSNNAAAPPQIIAPSKQVSQSCSISQIGSNPKSIKGAAISHTVSHARPNIAPERGDFRIKKR